jgi:hypothetical protein
MRSSMVPVTYLAMAKRWSQNRPLSDERDRGAITLAIVSIWSCVCFGLDVGDEQVDRTYSVEIDWSGWEWL